MYSLHNFREVAVAPSIAAEDRITVRIAQFPVF